MLRRGLHQALIDVGHSLVPIGAHRWACTRCKQAAVRHSRREWLQQGPCIPIRDGRPCPGRVGFFGKGPLHDSYALRWDASRQGWSCASCGAFSSRRAGRSGLVKPCRRPTGALLHARAVRTAQRDALPSNPLSPDSAAPHTSAASERWGVFEARVLARLRAARAAGASHVTSSL